MKTAQWNAFQNALRCFRWISQSECSLRWRGRGRGGIGSGSARCGTVKPRWKYSTTCTRDVSNKMHKRSFQFYFRRFPAKQTLLIPSGACRSNPWCKIKEWLRVGCFFRCHALAFRSLISSAPCMPGCPCSTLWWFDSHTPRSPEPPGEKE